MAVVRAGGALIKELERAGISERILDNCRNAKFLTVLYDGGDVEGVCFVSGFLNTIGTEVASRYRGRGISRVLLEEMLGESKRRKMPFLTGAFKPANVPSIRAHAGIGCAPAFTFHYSRAEGKEIVVFLPLNGRGALVGRLLRAFDTRVGNAAFALAIKGTRPFLKALMGFNTNTIPRVDLSYSLRNFEKVRDTINTHGIDQHLNLPTKN